MILNILVVNKIATFQKRDGCIVCGNSDYQIKFTFDSDWDAYTDKTARFIWNGEFIDVDFTGDTCDVPIIKDTDSVKVGVYAGELKTTTPAEIGCYRSILCDDVQPNAESIEASVKDDYLNIVYGLKYPENTSALWLRMKKPQSVVATPELQGLKFVNDLETKMADIIFPEEVGWAYAAVGTKLYFFGGTIDGTKKKSISRFDLETGETTILEAELPDSLSQTAAVAVDTKIYILGGTSIFCFDTETETCDYAAFNVVFYSLTMPLGIAVNNKVYFINDMRASNNIYCFDPVDNSYKLFCTLEGAKYSTSFQNWRPNTIVAIDSKIYFLAADRNTYHMHLWCLDTDNAVASELASVGFDGRAQLEQAVLFVMGQDLIIYDTKGKAKKYNMETGILSDSDIVIDGLNGLKNILTFPFDDSLYMFHGSTDFSGGGTINTSLFEYRRKVLGEAFLKDQLHLHTSMEGNLFRLANTDKLKMDVSIQGAYVGTEEGVAIKQNAYLYKDGAWQLV